jgi:hypothetical protein
VHGARRDYKLAALVSECRQIEAVEKMRWPDENLGRRSLPSAKRSPTLTTTLPAAPSVISLIHPHVLWRKQMAIAAGSWYRAGVGCNRPAGAAVGKADYFGFGCFKARPRNHPN